MGAELKPDGPIQRWLARRVVAAAVAADRGTWEEEARLECEALLARLDWDNQRRLEVAQLAAGLGRAPGRIAYQLRQTLQGADWLLAAWRALAGRLGRAAPAGLGLADRRRACDLLGLAHEHRGGRTPLDPPAGSTITRRDYQRALIQREIDDLDHRTLHVLGALDERDRQAAASGNGRDDDPTLRRIRRDAADAERRRRRAQAELKRRQDKARAEKEAELEELDAYLRCDDLFTPEERAERDRMRREVYKEIYGARTDRGSESASSVVRGASW
jgi:hypothetical protein